MYLVSVAVNKGIYAVLVVKDGKQIDKIVGRVPVEMSENVFTKQLYAIRQSIRRIKGVLNDNGYSDAELTFAVNNSTIVGWVNECKAKECYQEYFYETMQSLDELPVEYRFVCTPKLLAMPYAKESYITKKLNLVSIGE